MSSDTPTRVAPGGDFAPLIARAAADHGLPIALVAALVRVESGGNPWAVRYEPEFFERYMTRRRLAIRAPCTVETERHLQACSFGLLQIMGATAREVGFAGVFLIELCEPGLGLHFGCRYLARQAERFYPAHGWEGVAASYNAGSVRFQAGSVRYVNQPYVDKVRAAGGFA